MHETGSCWCKSVTDNEITQTQLTALIAWKSTSLPSLVFSGTDKSVSALINLSEFKETTAIQWKVYLIIHSA
jgi:hypothetical protein